MKPITTTALGTVSLTVSVGGLIATELAMRQGWLAAPGWKVLLQAFEAATVGGLADWFAVSALFREVPLPLIRRHTNIIVRNRQRIVDGIADMVQNRWLSPAIIREYLEHFSASQYALDFLANENHAETVLATARDIIRQLARGADAPELAAFLERALKDQLSNVAFAKPLGRWFGERLRRGDHHCLWDTVLPVLTKALRGPEVQTIVQRVVARALEAYQDAGLLKRLAVDMARGLNLVNEKEIVAAFLAKAEEALRAAQSDPAHPIRTRLDGAIIEFADKLAAGDADAVAQIEKLRAVLIHETDARALIQSALSRLVETFEREFKDAASDLNTLLRRTFHERLEMFRADPAAQDKFDRWVRQAAFELMERRHAMIGEIVRSSLEKLSDFDLAGQIEEKVGRDLQYIRLNGAIVGGLAGAVLALVKLLI